MLFTQKTQGNEKYSCSRGATSGMYGSRKHIVFLFREEETRLLSDYGLCTLCIFVNTTYSVFSKTALDFT
jgi:hypothetical protein